MKKIFISIIIAFTLSFIFYLPSAFAENMVKDATNGVRNAVGGAEKVTEDAAKGAAGAVKNGINTMGNAAQNTMNNMENGAKNLANDATNNTDYTVSRTAGETNNNFLGFMGDNMWAWIIIGIIAIVVIGIIWYYMARQSNYRDHND